MRKILLLLVCLCALVLQPSVAHAAIARDAVAASTGTASGFTLTISHDCGTGANRFVVVGLNATSADDITGVTWNTSENLVLLDKSTGGREQIWGLHAPSTGTHNIVISNSGFHFMAAVVKCYTGVQQSTTPDSVSGSADNANGTSFSMSTTTVGDNSWGFFSVHCDITSESCAAGTGSSLVGQILDATFGSINLFDSNAAITPAGSYSMTTTSTGATTRYASLVSLAPAGAGGGSVAPRGLLLGVGP